MKYYVCGYTDKGEKTDKNEDRILVNRKVFSKGFTEAEMNSPFICGVCDGVSGENSGEVSAEIALESLATLEFSSLTDMRKELTKIHRHIKQEGVRRENCANTQTTFIGLTVDEEDNCTCVNVGDSRMYRFSEGEIRQISTDQSYGQYLYEHSAVEIPKEYKNAIISSLGSTLNEPDIVQTPLVTPFGRSEDDLIIITSDGISDFVSKREFEIGLKMKLTLKEKAEALAQLAIMNGSRDNLSIIIVKPLPEKEKPQEEETEKEENILEINLNDIVSKPKAENPEPKPVDFTTDYLENLAKESLDKLSKL